MSAEPNNEEKAAVEVDTAVDSKAAEKNKGVEDDVFDKVVDCQGKAAAKEAEQTSENALEETLSKIVDLEDQMLRERAETQNIRRRVQKDVENARKFALEKFVSELLPVIDNLERALEASGDVAAVKEGIELTLKSFLDVLAKFQVEALDPLGEPFDANFHQAMTMVLNPDMEPNTVMDVMQKGYTLNGRLMRPAMVVVSKA